MKKQLPKIVVSSAAASLFGARLLWPDFSLDSVSLLILLVAIAPWLSWAVQSFELPGGLKVTLRDVEAAASKVRKPEATAEKTETAQRAIRSEEHSFVRVADYDANLALVALRIEIEKRLRDLADFRGLRQNQPLRHMVDKLRIEGAVDAKTSSGLMELIIAGNKAAHGAKVEDQVAGWALNEGPQVLAALDAELRVVESEDLKEFLDRAVSIVSFHGPDLVEICETLLKSAKRDGNRITLAVGTQGKKDLAREILERLEAIVPVGDDVSPRWGIHYRITTKGVALLSRLIQLGDEPRPQNTATPAHSATPPSGSAGR